MAKRTRQVATMIVAIFVVAGVICFQHFSTPPGLPSTAEPLSDKQMQNIRGGPGDENEEPKKCKKCQCASGDAGSGMYISVSYGAVWTKVPLCTVESTEGATIDLALHYDSGKADGSIARRQTVLGYGWTHNYNIYLVVRSREVFMPDETGRVTRFRERFDGGYTVSAGQTHTLSQVDPNTFLLEEVDGSKRTFKLFDPAPWPTSGQLFQLTQIKDAQGQTTTLGYNTQGLLETITDPFGRQVSFTYNANKRIETITNADGEVTQIDYQGVNDNLWRITDTLGYKLEYSYDSWNRMTTEKLKDGNTWTCVYNGGGKPYQLIDGDGQIYATVTNPVNWAIDNDRVLQFNEVRYIPASTTMADGRGNETIYHYDANGYITKVENADGTEKTYEFNDDLWVIMITDEEGNTWFYEYDEHGNRTKITDPLSNETQMFYEHLNIPALLTKRIEPDANEWIFEYDPNGNLIKEIDPIVESPNDAVIIHTYDTNGLRISTTDRNGHTTKWEYDSNGMMIREIVDPCGLDIVTDYEYDAAGRSTKQTLYRGPGLTDPVVTDYEYDAMGQLTQETIDPCGLGLTTLYEYDGAGRTVDQNNPRGVITHYEYDVRGRLVKQIKDPCGLSLTTEYEYDGSDNQTGLIDPNGNETTYEYDDRNRLVKRIDAENYWTLYEYDSRGNQTRVSRSIDPCGPPYRVTEYSCDELNRYTHVIADACGLDLTTVFEYTPAGGCSCTGTPGGELIYKKTDPAGKVTYYYYDQLDRRTSEVRKVGDVNDNGGDANDAITNYEYDGGGNLIRTAVQNSPEPNLVTTYSYDAANRPIKLVQGPNDANLVTTYSYDGADNVIQRVTPVGNVISSAYDKADRLTSRSDSNGVIFTYSYDENGNLLTESDGLGHTWTYSNDNADRRITACDPLVETPSDKCTTYEYDDNGNLTQVTDNEGLVTTCTYDGLDRRIETTQDPCGLNINITYAYDGAGNQTQITDDNGNATTYEYDGANRKTRQIYADGTDRLFGYDAASNMTSRTDQMGNVTTYSYDDLHRLISASFANGQQNIYTYSRAGQVLAADNDHSHVGRSYDDVGRVTGSTQTDLPQTYSYTVSYDYNTVDNTRTLTYPSGKEVVEVYDVRNRLAEVWQDGVKTTWYTYDNPSDRTLTRNFANNTHSEYAYNDNDWVTQLKHIAPNGSDILAGFAHSYDAVGNRLDANNLQDVLSYDAAKAVTQSEKYTYDSIYRLVDFKRGQVVAGDIPSPTRTRSWQLDGVQNWSQFGIDGKTYSNSTNQMNEYDDPSTDGPGAVPDDDGLPDDFMADTDVLMVDLDDNGKLDFMDFVIFASYWLEESCMAPDFCGRADFDQDGIVDYSDLKLITSLWLKEAGYNFAHDKNGNLVDDSQREYYYDYQTSMAGAVRARNQMTMVKDKATGATLAQYFYDALGGRIRKVAGGVTTVYVYTYNWQAIEEYQDAALVRSYAYGDWIDEVLTMDRVAEADRLYYHDNALGSIIAVTDNSGSAAERYGYDAYGQPLFADASGNSLVASGIGNPYLFTGRRYDGEADLYYYRTRYLHPIAGRFTTRDVIGLWGDENNLGNGYAYAGCNPQTRVDPMGNKDPLAKRTKPDSRREHEERRKRRRKPRPKQTAEQKRKETKTITETIVIRVKNGRVSIKDGEITVNGKDITITIQCAEKKEEVPPPKSKWEKIWEFLMTPVKVVKEAIKLKEDVEELVKKKL